MSQHQPPVIANPWQALRQYTDARIALGRAGVSLPTRAHLAFQLAHAQARDAVHLGLDVQALQAGLGALSQQVLLLHSAAGDRNTYLQRPDLGRRLDDASRAALSHQDEQAVGGNPPLAARNLDLVVVIADGLSAPAVGKHAVPLLERILPRLQSAGWTVGPLALVTQGRVAVGDDVGALLGARLVLVLIGERPGLSSPDSMGAYLTWMPTPGLTDACRNCVSNIRPAGLAYDEAAHKLQVLMDQARARQLSGLGLKDETNPIGVPVAGQPASSFLLADRR